MIQLADVSLRETVIACVLGGLGIVAVIVIVFGLVWWFSNGN